MMNKIAYSEVYSFINSLPANEYYTIPTDVVEYINWHRDYKYKFNYDASKTLDEQNFSREAITLILKLFYEYFANNDEKNKINKILYENEEIRNIELKEKYNIDNIFKNKNKYKSVQQSNENITALVEYKDNIFKKLKDLIIGIKSYFLQNKKSNFKK